MYLYTLSATPGINTVPDVPPSICKSGLLWSLREGHYRRSRLGLNSKTKTFEGVLL